MSPAQEAKSLLLQLVPQSPLRGKVFLVGGGVRDELLGLSPLDLDLCVEEPQGARDFAAWLHERFPEQVSRPHLLGAGYPIWQVVFQDDVVLEGRRFAVAGLELEMADTQSEAFPDPQTRQRITRFGTLEEDCRRRDFTVNMLYWDLTKDQLVDPSGQGRADLSAGILRGHPQVDLAKIFADDPLRMLRLFRFHCRFGWKIPPEVLTKVQDQAARVKILSAERIRDELSKMAVSGRFEEGLKLMAGAGLLAELFPELLSMQGCEQDRHYHSEGDVWVHTLRVVAAAPKTLVLQLAALLHDLGKPSTQERVGDRIKFLGHEKISESLGRDFLLRLRFDGATVERVAKLIALHLRGGDATQWASAKPARRLMRDAGEALPELLQLIEADSRSSLGPEGQPRLEHLEALQERLEEAKKIPLRKEALLSGHEIMAVTGLKPGPRVGAARRYLDDLEDEAAAEGRALTKEEALKKLASFR